MLRICDMLIRFEQFRTDENKFDFNERAYSRKWKEKAGEFELVPLTKKETFSSFNERVRELKQETKTASTFHKYHSFLSVAFTKAIQGHLGNELRCSVFCNPMKDIQKLPRGKRYREPFTNAEVKRLLQACKESKNEDLYYIVKLIALTGRRRSEILCIESSMINTHRRLVIIPFEKTKTKKKDTVIPILDDEIWRYLVKKKKSCKGKIFTFKNPRKALCYALERAGISTKKQFHALRHTVCTVLYENGESDAALYIGHSDPATASKHYLHERTGMFEKNQRKLIDVFGI